MGWLVCCSSGQNQAKALHRGQKTRGGSPHGLAVCPCMEDANLKNCLCLGRCRRGGWITNWNILWTLQWLQKCLRMIMAAASCLKKIQKLSQCPASALGLRVPVRCPLSFLLRHDLGAWICPALSPSLSSGWSSLSWAPGANAVGPPPPSVKLKEVCTAGYALGQCFSASQREQENLPSSPWHMPGNALSCWLLLWGRQLWKALCLKVN